jgi:hypothetical protein
MRTKGALIVFGLIVGAASLSPLAQRGPTAPVWPGYQGEGVTLLPNGWRIAPEGRHVTVGDLPMNMVPSPDGRFLAIATSGYTEARAQHLRRQVTADRPSRRARTHVARAGVASRRQAALRLRFERERPSTSSRSRADG